MSKRFIGGLQVFPSQNTTQPWVELWATADSLTFSLRFGRCRQRCVSHQDSLPLEAFPRVHVDDQTTSGNGGRSRRLVRGG
jgi:hypothetical protein